MPRRLGFPIRLFRNSNDNDNDSSSSSSSSSSPDPFDWHSIPDSGQNNEFAKNFGEEDFDFEGVDVFLDDIVEDYITASNPKKTSQRLSWASSYVHRRGIPSQSIWPMPWPTKATAIKSC